MHIGEKLSQTKWNTVLENYEPINSKIIVLKGKSDKQFSTKQFSSLQIISDLGNFKEKFEKGPEDAHEVKKTEVEARCSELGNIKDAFESGKFRNSEEVGVFLAWKFVVNVFLKKSCGLNFIESTNADDVNK